MRVIAGIAKGRRLVVPEGGRTRAATDRIRETLFGILTPVLIERKDGKPLDGFALAQRDLEIRGAGEFLGDEQSGVDELRIVDLKDVDPRLARETAEDADAILGRDPTLERPEHAGLAVAVEALWRRYALA